MRRSAAALIVTIGVLVSCGREKVDFKELIAAIDGELTLGAVKQADEIIIKAASIAVGRSEWLSLLKRAYTLGSAAGSYETLFATSKAALSKISGAEEIAALCVFSGLRTGRYEIAFQYAGEYLSSDKWASIRDEAVLRRHAIAGGVLPSSSEDSPLLNAVFSQDPVALARAAGLFNESRFALAAALRFAAEGEIDTAADTLMPYGLEYPEAALLLFYDAGRYSEAAAIAASAEPPEILRTGEFDLIRGDIFLRLKDPGSALELYQELMDEAPDVSWIPYANASLILSEQGHYDEAMEMIAAGKDAFPDERQLLLFEILVYSTRDKTTAVNLIYKYRELYPADPEIAVIAAAVLPSEANKIRLENVMWNAFFQNPANYRVSGDLAASLLASNDGEGLSKLLDIWERENGDTAWSVFLRGYLALMNRSVENAVEAFEKSNRISPRWEIAYNLSVIARRTGEYDQAIGHLRDAENMLPEKWPLITPTRGLIRAAVARVLYERGDFESALREARYAIDLDPGSNEASLIIALLEHKRD